MPQKIEIAINCAIKIALTVAAVLILKETGTFIRALTYSSRNFTDAACRNLDNVGNATVNGINETSARLGRVTDSAADLLVGVNQNGRFPTLNVNLE